MFGGSGEGQFLFDGTCWISPKLRKTKRGGYMNNNRTWHISIITFFFIGKPGIPASNTRGLRKVRLYLLLKIRTLYKQPGTVDK